MKIFDFVEKLTEQSQKLGIFIFFYDENNTYYYIN